MTRKIKKFDICNKIATLTLLFFLVAIPCYAVTEKEEFAAAGYKLSESFAKCAALYDAVRDLTLSLGEPDMAQIFNDTSNGAQLVAEWIARDYAAIKNYVGFVESIYDRQLILFKVHLKQEGMKSETIQMEITMCTDLSPLQSAMVEDIRRIIYGADTSNNKYFK